MELKPEYSEEIHAKRLQDCLELADNGDICDFCPATAKYSTTGDVDALWSVLGPFPCRICLEFLGLEKQLGMLLCPCIQLEGDREKAIALSWKCLKEKGYVNE